MARRIPKEAADPWLLLSPADKLKLTPQERARVEELEKITAEAMHEGQRLCDPWREMAEGTKWEEPPKANELPMALIREAKAKAKARQQAAEREQSKILLRALTRGQTGN